MHIRAAIVLLSWLTLLSATARGTDVVLTIGGGYAPGGNQVSLEKNVRFLGEVLERTLPAGYRHSIFFADGDDPHRDVQYLAGETPESRAEQLLAQVFDDDEYFFERYRNHKLPQVAEATTKENLKEWFVNVGRKLGADDRLLIYVTAHGGPSNDERKPFNTTLHLWNNEEITVQDFANELDQLAPELPVVIVMVQCYSGGFSHLLFTGGDPRNGLAPHRRCGFFATTHDRVAAGCTPAINEADYQEYSSGFWAALIGQTRIGEPLEKPDYDKDGATSFAEAHAHVLIHSDTIDLPVKTTDAFLRVYSDLRPERRLAQREDEQTSSTLRPVAPLAIDAPIDSLLAAADPIERAVIHGLSTQLKLDQTDRAIAIGELMGAIDDQRDRLRRQTREVRRDENWVRRGIVADLLLEWPELTGPWNPEGRRLVREESEAIVTFIESHPLFDRWQAARTELAEIEQRSGDLELKDVKCQRLLYMLESVTLANNLPLVADETRIRQYLALRAAEHGTLGE